MPQLYHLLTSIYCGATAAHECRLKQQRRAVSINFKACPGCGSDSKPSRCVQLSTSHHKLCKLHWLPARRRREVTSDAAVELQRTAADCELRHRRVTTTKQSYAGAAPLSKCLRTGPNIDAAQAHRVPRRHRRRYQGASGRCRRNCRMRKKAYRTEGRYSEMLRHIE